MREREQANVGVARDLRRLKRRRMQGVGRAAPLVLEEGRLTVYD